MAKRGGGGRGDALIEVLRALPDVWLMQADAIAKELEAHTNATVAANTDGYGEPWPPAVKAGDALLVNAAKKVQYEVSGATVSQTVRGVECRHHLGWINGGKKPRPIILTRKYIPPALYARFERVLEDGLAKVVSGG